MNNSNESADFIDRYQQVAAQMPPEDYQQVAQ